MFLYINTTERDEFTVALVGEQGIVRQKRVKSVRGHSEKLLKTVNDLLSSPSRPSPQPSPEGRGSLRGIAVVKGPGSFTSLRIGVSTANALAFAWGVPVLGVGPEFSLNKVPSLFKKARKRGVVLPEYGREPNITRPKDLET